VSANGGRTSPATRCDLPTASLASLFVRLLRKPPVQVCKVECVKIEGDVGSRRSHRSDADSPGLMSRKPPFYKALSVDAYYPPSYIWANSFALCATCSRRGHRACNHGEGLSMVRGHNTLPPAYQPSISAHLTRLSRQAPASPPRIVPPLRTCLPCAFGFRACQRTTGRCTRPRHASGLTASIAKDAISAPMAGGVCQWKSHASQ
jgi:hypothetical protein